MIISPSHKSWRQYSPSTPNIRSVAVHPITNRSSSSTQSSIRSILISHQHSCPIFLRHSWGSNMIIPFHTWCVLHAHSHHTLYINPMLPDDFWFKAWLNGQKLWWGPSVLTLIKSIKAINDYTDKNSARIRYFCNYYDLEQVGEFIVRVLTAIRHTVLQKTRPDDRQLYGRASSTLWYASLPTPSQPTMMHAMII